MNTKYCKCCKALIPYKKRGNIFCNSSCAASFNNRGRIRTDESKKLVSLKVRRYKATNPDKERERIEVYKKTCALRSPPRLCTKCNKKVYKYNKYDFCKDCWYQSDEFQKCIGHNRSYDKQYVYNKWDDSYVYLLSSLEKKYYDYLTRENIEWYKPKPLEYKKHDNTKHLYFPDFWLKETNEYIEVKGHMWSGDKEKLDLVKDQHKIKLIILKKKDIVPLHNSSASGFEPEGGGAAPSGTTNLRKDG